MPDAIDTIVGQWSKERPDLANALWPVQLLGRAQRLARFADKSAKEIAAKHGVEHGEFDVLSTLQRSGPPYTLTAGALLKAAMVTSGAITNRIDRMEAKGLVERVRDGEDRRTVQIRLTSQGHEVMSHIISDHLANYARLLADVDRETCTRTADGLRAVLEALGDASLR
ncbi:MarR family winged helix-turn-helix transcriptional regulator [Streptomyces purpureus]|uniref:MarR family winged helix-turn-helix transcriptional regulator n=1 Tax=Streptomyces purpureus TaxID=1951 RepID=UPI0037BADFA7